MSACFTSPAPTCTKYKTSVFSLQSLNNLEGGLCFGYLDNK